MKIRRRDQIAALGMGVVLAILCPVKVWAFDPWSNVNGYWISADGKSAVEGAVKKGVTITKYQNKAGKINWEEMSRDDVSFAMVRLGYYEDLDPYFETNMLDAEKAKIDAGICFYSKAATVEEARKEAAYVLDIAKGYRVSYPISYEMDVQYAEEKKLTRPQLTQQARAFCDTIEEAGYKVVIFGDNDWLTQNLELRKLPYDIWYSRYGMAHSFENRTLWRCTDRGTVQGVEGSVCLEFAFVNYRKIFPAAGWREINGTMYYFRDYKMVRDTAVRIGDTVYFFDEKGNGRLSR
ncbi:MAG: glycoside hydrolase [Hungatella sp.]|nr:glycoside hydrolase [Hungatella sp.]